MAKRIIGTTPKQDGYRMPAEFEPQQGVWMLWPDRNDNWRDGGKPAQKAFADVAKAIASLRTRAPSSPKISASWSSRATTRGCATAGRRSL